MKTKIQQRLYYLFRECLLILCTINIPWLVGCSDDNEMGIIIHLKRLLSDYLSLMRNWFRYVVWQMSRNVRLAVYKCSYTMILTPHLLYIIRRVRLIHLFCLEMEQRCRP